VLQVDSPDDSDRDRFVLSKGHAALALYAVLELKGWISPTALDTFCGEDSHFGVHPETAVRGIDFCSGSLGHGLSMAAGAALAGRLQHSSRRVYCLISDAECNEGAVWEAAMFASHHRLANLTVIIDWNGQQALGRTCDVLNCSNLEERWSAFGWLVSRVDGHSVDALSQAMSDRSNDNSLPRVILAQTTFGKGVSYMERGLPLSQPHLPVQPVNWHYLPMSDEEFEIAIQETEPDR
jgi:transketolase